MASSSVHRSRYVSAPTGLLLSMICLLRTAIGVAYRGEILRTLHCSPLCLEGLSSYSSDVTSLSLCCTQESLVRCHRIERRDVRKRKERELALHGRRRQDLSLAVLPTGFLNLVCRNLMLSKLQR